MPTEDKFPEALAAIEKKLLSDEQTTAAAQVALDKHMAAIRKLAVSSASMGRRVAKLAAADQELLDTLEGLTDTEPEMEPTPTEGGVPMD